MGDDPIGDVWFRQLVIDLQCQSEKDSLVVAAAANVRDLEAVDI